MKENQSEKRIEEDTSLIDTALSKDIRNRSTNPIIMFILSLCYQQFFHAYTISFWSVYPFSTTKSTKYN